LVCGRLLSSTKRHENLLQGAFARKSKCVTTSDSRSTTHAFTFSRFHKNENETALGWRGKGPGAMICVSETGKGASHDALAKQQQ